MNGVSQQSKLRACFIYYQDFHPMVYREAMALKKVGYGIDIICLRSSRETKNIRYFEGLRIFAIQTRSAAEKRASVYFIHLMLFFFKAFALTTCLEIRYRYRLVHVTSPPDIMIFVALLPKLLGARVILDIHDIGPELFMRKLNIRGDHPVISVLKMLEKLSSRFSDHVLTVTSIWRDKLISRSVAAKKCSVLLNVPDNDLFQPRQRKLGTGPIEYFNLYYHGSIEEHCGVDTILDAIPTIRSVIPNIRVHIYPLKVGRSLDEYVKYSQNKMMDSYVTFHKPVPFYELPDILSDADIGIVPTKSAVFSEELLAMKSLEYISLGIPIIVSKTKAHSIYFDNSMVKFFNPEDSKDMAGAVISLYSNRSAMAEQVRRSRSFLVENDWTKAKKTYLQIATGRDV
jgi:glycosyltransferase involved in cell wall biosynthesis